MAKRQSMTTKATYVTFMRRETPHSRRTCGLLAAALAALLVGPQVSRAQVVDVEITADNAYAFGFGSTLKGTILPAYFHGPVENCTAGEIFSCADGPERYNGIAVPGVGSKNPHDSCKYFYIVAWSDNEVTQGVLASVTGPLNIAAVSGVGNWEVYATGKNYDCGSGGPTLPQINEEILRANDNMGASDTSSIGWVGPSLGLPGLPGGSVVFGEPNDGTTVPSPPIAPNNFPHACTTNGLGSAKWMWYYPADSTGADWLNWYNISDDFRQAINVFNTNPGEPGGPIPLNPSAPGHREFLIFRLPCNGIPGLRILGTCINNADCTCTDGLTEDECTGVDRQEQCVPDVTECGPGRCCLQDGPTGYRFCMKCLPSWDPALRCADVNCGAIPAVSEWGLIGMTLLLLTGLKIKFGRRQPR